MKNGAPKINVFALYKCCKGVQGSKRTLTWTSWFNQQSPHLTSYYSRRKSRRNSKIQINLKLNMFAQPALFDRFLKGYGEEEGRLRKEKKYSWILFKTSKHYYVKIKKDEKKIHFETWTTSTSVFYSWPSLLASCMVYKYYKSNPHQEQTTKASWMVGAMTLFLKECKWIMKKLNELPVNWVGGWVEFVKIFEVRKAFLRKVSSLRNSIQHHAASM